MSITKTIETLFQKYIPSPFVIAIILTLLTMVLALLFTENPSETAHPITILTFWEEGIWNNNLLVFAYQMMLILVLGHVLVLSKPMNWLISQITVYAKDTSSAVILVSITTMLVAFFNWGLGLIFGAIIARKIGEAAVEKGFKINYPLVGAAGYIGLMVWHGGMSGSAPLKVAEEGHLASLMNGIASPEVIAQLPSKITDGQTIFSWWNLLIFGILLIVIPFTFYLLSRNGKTTALPDFSTSKKFSEHPQKQDKLDNSKLLAIGFGFILLIAFFARYYGKSLSPNMLNFLMLGLGIILHGNFKNFLKAVEEAIGGASGILIQFPLYFGIMGIMKSTGMVTMISDGFIAIATETTLPIFTFFSAGLVNIFVPSGGGQWAIQGPIVIESALSLGVPLPKAIMALAYGDQVTNMLQPFWALPLLGITKLKAKEILPYTLILMVVGSAIYILGLLLL
ncbi:short-chain fatty acid transporter [Dokdonia pacifica]|uniref:Short-chain fatty acids transporter n=1 Tax=Dokdonia pacifica TaxID=1627892 RepID=A0A238W5C6_9FLAO|nr:TIGR00366 family protein [Dokdonia pacifica]GGG14866.1 short-chain fatty acid transporter [Dokdonia pacifica]SNR41760.1 short-chain fatty acids transporter [Dokdonia pacifica]